MENKYKKEGKKSRKAAAAANTSKQYSSAGPSTSQKNFANFEAAGNHPEYNCFYHRECRVAPLPEGVELNLPMGFKIKVACNGNIHVENDFMRVAVSPNNLCSAVHHPNGKVYQTFFFTDVIAYDGCRRNNFIRYAKILSDKIHLTSEGCGLNYTLDTNGIRTSQSLYHVNRDWINDYCNLVYYSGTVPVANGMKLLDNYRCDYRPHSDVIRFGNVTITIEDDGMITIVTKKIVIHMSLNSRSITLKTPKIKCTASMGHLPHLFVRKPGRRVYFDGGNFNTRLCHHSASFDSFDNVHFF